MKNMFYKKTTLWVMIFIFLYAMALQRPVHQDDGWYASFALRYLDMLGMIPNASYFSYFDSNGGHDGPMGVTFALLQTVFYFIYDFSIPATRLFNALSIFGIVLVFHSIVAKELPKFKWWLTAILIIHPVFYYHFYNRPEIIAALIALISIYGLLYKGEKKIAVIGSYFLWAFILDTHPIAIFSVVGVGVWFWVKNFDKTKIIITGGILGLVAQISINQAINGNIGLFAFALGQVPANFGDHYVPLMKSNLWDYVRIATARLDTIKSFVFLSGIWIAIPLILIKKNKLDFLTHPLVINYGTFVLLSSLGTEASGNGFALYSIINLFLLYVVSLKLLFKDGLYKHAWIMLLPLLISSVISTARVLKTYTQYNANFKETYASFSNCIKPNLKYLMRPTFVYENHNKNISSDITYGLMNVMRDKNMKFIDAVIYKEYDYIALDEQNLKEEFILDNRVMADFSSPAYNSYQNTGLTQSEFTGLISSGQLQAVCEFDEISHGHTVLYKVNKKP